MHTRSRRWLGWGVWALGILLTGLLIHRVGVSTLRDLLGQVGPKILWMFAAYAAGTALAALPWRQLIPGAARPSWGAVISSRFAASGLNAIFPFFGAGEAGRLLWLERRFWPDGVAALIVDRLLYVTAGAFLLMAGVAAAFGIPELPRTYDLAGALVALTIVAGVAVIVLVGARGQSLARLERAVRWIATRVLGRARRETRPEGDVPLRAVLTGPKRRLLWGLMVHCGARLLLAGEVYAGLHVLGVQTTPAETLVFVSVPIALSVVGTFIPGQIGLQEGVQALVAAALGIGPATGVALVLLSRARQLLFLPLSALLLKVVRSSRASVSPGALGGAGSSG